MFFNFKFLKQYKYIMKPRILFYSLIKLSVFYQFYDQIAKVSLELHLTKSWWSLVRNSVVHGNITPPPPPGVDSIFILIFYFSQKWIFLLRLIQNDWLCRKKLGKKKHWIIRKNNYFYLSLLNLPHFHFRAIAIRQIIFIKKIG